MTGKDTTFSMDLLAFLVAIGDGNHLYTISIDLFNVVLRE